MVILLHCKTHNTESVCTGKARKMMSMIEIKVPSMTSGLDPDCALPRTLLCTCSLLRLRWY